MSLARMVIPGATYLLTRRCVERRFRLRPDSGLAETFGYCLARAAAKYGILVHAVVTMGNHWHAIVSDPEGNISAFARDVHALVARCLNARYGASEAVWSSVGLSLVRLVGPQAILQRLVYVETNPVAAGLVARSRVWPGLRLTPANALEGPRRFRRPPGFFRDSGPCAEEVSLQVTLPPGFEHLAPVAFVGEVEEAVARREAEVQAAMKRDGRRFEGVARVRARRRDSTPRTTEERRTRRPTIACADTARRLAEIARLVTFRQRYRDALTLWREGARPVLFPYGTNKMRDYPGVVLARPPDPLRAAA